MLKGIKGFFQEEHGLNLRAREILRYIGPGILVTVGFIDPGNWAANLAAGAEYGYKLLWMVTLSTIMLIVLQHNVAHLGIVTGRCLSEAATEYLRPLVSRTVLFSAITAAVATGMAEILGAAIALQMLFHVPLKIGALLTGIGCSWMLWANSYKRLEKWIMGFVSIIGAAFLFELSLVNIEWSEAAIGWVTPVIPDGAMLVVMSVLGAVVMPHNLFLHSEVIQSRQWNLEDDVVIKRQLKYEFADTLFSMCIGWAINSAMILVAAAVFFSNQVSVDELEQAEIMLRPLLGNAAAVVFAIALLFAGISSTVTAGMAGGSIFAGIFREPYDIKDRHSWMGVAITYGLAVAAIFFIESPFQGLVYSQMFLSIQLPWTIFLQIYLTSSTKVMGKYANTGLQQIVLWGIGLIVSVLNMMLLWDFIK
ncbi:MULTISPECIES: Nramp family divalent metal transporter [Pelosinus]|uniref:Natural resistance-associated macrophage protein n=1 Tax=Pelosinus fermentans B4 TaxID=1149862 RepID=I8RHF0_9FIRM|nr:MULTISPECIES: Nramp family divalent metal transporter [Pelosinus]EIW19178.1 natural resistance-associated macrophage protein [Pelosinus fermentans B4]EIW25090.1 natural resistance-associated macrophage protein [Pelosinus fermentans A11]